jgi:hypothetical protein
MRVQRAWFKSFEEQEVEDVLSKNGSRALKSKRLKMF